METKKSISNAFNNIFNSNDLDTNKLTKMHYNLKKKNKKYK